MAYPNVDELLIAIRILADSRKATKEIQEVEKELRRLRSQASQTQAYLKDLFSKGIISKETYQQVIGKINSELGRTSNQIDQIERGTRRVHQGLWSWTNVIRTALGTLEAMAIFLIAKFVGDTMAKAIDSVKQLELAIYNLAVAEKSLSRLGVEISPEDFEEIIKSVKDLNLAISDIDITKSVADLATGLRDLGLAKEQIEGLSQAAAIIAVSKGLTMEDVVKQFVLGIAKGGRGLADLDIQVNDSVIKQKALEAQLVESEAAWNSLTASQRQSLETQALYLIIMDNAKSRMEELGLIQTSVTSASRELAASWEDLSTVMGQVFRPVTFGGFVLLEGAVLRTTQGMVYLALATVEFFGVLTGGISVIDAFARGAIKSLGDVEQAFLRGQEKARRGLLPHMFIGGAPDIGLPQSTQDFINRYKKTLPDTPTTPQSPIETEQEDLQKALEKMNNTILEAQIRLGQDMEEAAINLGRKLVDIAEEYARKRAEAEINLNNKIRDINRDFQNKIQEIQARQREEAERARNDELDREAKFQEKMRQLKEEFLFDLEEALHNRDARTILRLIRRYNLEKEQAEREHALEKENAAREGAARARRFAQQRKDLERERQIRIQAAKQEFQDKLEQLRREEEVERQAAHMAYQRKMEDLERELKDRLALVAAGLVQEFNLTNKGLNAIVELYRRYYANITSIYAAMNKMLTGQTSLTIPTTTSGGSGGGGGTALAMAEGGVLVADSPTTVTFGEAGPELAAFAPIGRTGRDVNKMFSNLSEGGIGGQIGIELFLSPDLETRIIKNTLGHAAEVITRVQGSKKR